MTTLLYLEDFDVTQAKGSVQEIITGEDGRQTILLDQTCFYPRGGGQDWDTGTIKSTANEFMVEEVRLDENGIVHHTGQFAGGSFNVGDEVELSVDADRRRLNTRLHSAGHLLDMAVDALGYGWIPGRGAHYPHMSFVEYEATIDPAEYERLVSEIQAKINELLALPQANVIKFMPVSEMGSVCRHVPTNIPTNKPARVVIYGDNFGVPCGGTHVKQLSEIGELVIVKLKSKKGTTKVSYALKD